LDAASLTMRRVAGYVVDVMALAIVLVPIAAIVSLVLGNDDVPALEVWVRSLVLISIPAWTYFVVTEHRWGAGLGKLFTRLKTVSQRTDAPPTWGAALVRTAVTLAPWELVHLAFFGLAPQLGEVTSGQIVVAILAYVLLAAYVVVTLRSGGRRSPADLLARTEVRRRAGD
jgi:hypothetical protein